MIGISISTSKTERLGEKVTKGARDGMRAAVEAGFELSQDLVPEDTGELKESGKITDEQGRDLQGRFTSGMTATFRYTADHAALVESGTEPHPIEPVNAEYLAFEVEGGETVFTKHVDHPGTDPQPYVEPGFEEMSRQLRQRGLSPHIEGELGGPI